MPEFPEMICDNLTTIQNNIARAAERSGRSSNEIKLVAVSKRHSQKKINDLANCGQIFFGENYLQEAQEKISHLKSTLCWHFIGHLQSNKAKLAVTLFDVIETVDRIKIARALHRYAAKSNRELQIFVQVNIGRERQKHGVLPDDTENLLQLIKQETDLKVLGLMGMPPKTTTPESSRVYFRELKKLAERLADKDLFLSPRAIQLSMGMSSDYQIAIEEGATLVRVGTALFGQRE